MLSAKLIRLIEHHWDEIVSRVLRRISHDPETTHIGKLPEAELREWAQNILENLGHWLADAGEGEVARRYEALGKLRFEEEVPLDECVRGLCILKEKVLAFLEEQALARTSMDLYAAEELENRLGRFFDEAVCHLVRGYEGALRKVAHLSVKATSSTSG